MTFSFNVLEYVVFTIFGHTLRTIRSNTYKIKSNLYWNRKWIFLLVVSRHDIISPDCHIYVSWRDRAMINDEKEDFFPFKSWNVIESVIRNLISQKVNKNAAHEYASPLTRKSHLNRLKSWASDTDQWITFLTSFYNPMLSLLLLDFDRFGVVFFTRKWKIL